jgi:zinc protease
MKLSNWLEDHMAELNSSTGLNGIKLSFKCLKSDFPEMKKIIIDLMKNPSFDEKEIVLYKKRVEAKYKRDASNPQKLHDDFRNHILYKGQRDSLSQKERVDIILKLKRDDFISLYKKYFMSKNLLFALFGDITEEEAKEYLKEISSIIVRKIPKGKKVSLKVPSLNGEFKNEYGYEQVNVNFNFKAVSNRDKDFYVLKVLNNLLTGNGNTGRLFEAVRGRNTLAYFTYSSYVATRKYGFFRITGQTSIDKLDKLIAVLKEEIKKLTSEKVKKEEIVQGAEEAYKSLKAALTGESLFKTMVYYEASGLGYDFLEKQLEAMKRVTPEEVISAAKKYFKNMAIIISYPSKDVKKIVK